MRSRNLDEVVGRFDEIIVNDSEDRLMRASHTIWESVICSTNIRTYKDIWEYIWDIYGKDHRWIRNLLLIIL